MALDDLFSVEFTPDELTRFDGALDSIETILKGKVCNLTPDERRQYGRIAEQNKLFVNKAKEFMELYPDLVPRYIDKAEFDRDYRARTQIEHRFLRLENLMERLSDTKVLLDHDNYNNALSFYRMVRTLSRENEPGTTVVYEGLKQFFSGGRPTVEEEPPQNEPDK